MDDTVVVQFSRPAPPVAGSVSPASDRLQPISSLGSTVTDDLGRHIATTLAAHDGDGSDQGDRLKTPLPDHTLSTVSADGGCCMRWAAAIARVIITQYFRPEDTFSQRLQMMLCLLGILVFLLNDIGGLYDTFTFAPSLEQHRDAWIAVGVVQAIGDFIPIVAYATLRCTGRLAPIWSFLICAGWTVSNLGSVVVIGRSEAAVISMTLAGTIVLAVEAPGAVVVALVNAAGTGMYLANTMAPKNDLFLADPAILARPSTTIATFIFVFGVTATFFVYVVVINHTYRTSVAAERLATLKAKAAARLAVDVAGQLANYDTDGVDSRLSQYAASDDCDPALLGGLRAISTNLRRYRPHLPNYVLRVASPSSGGRAASYFRNEDAAAAYDAVRDDGVVEDGMAPAAPEGSLDASAQRAVDGGGTGVSSAALTPTPSTMHSARRVTYCELSVIVSPLASGTGKPPAARTMDSRPYDALVRAAFEAAGAADAAVHSFVGDKLTLTWNATGSCTQPERSAARLAWLLSHAAVGAFEELTGTRVAASVATGWALCCFAGSSRQRTFVLSADLLKRAEELSRLGLEYAALEQDDGLAAPMVLLDALTAAKVAVSGTRLRGAALLPATLVERGSESELSDRSSPDYLGKPRVAYRLLSEPPVVHPPSDSDSVAALTQSVTSSQGDLLGRSSSSGTVTAAPAGTATRTATAIPPQFLDDVMTKVALALARGDVNRARLELEDSGGSGGGAHRKWNPAADPQWGAADVLRLRTRVQQAVKM